MLLRKQQDVTVQVSCWNVPVGSRFTFIHPWAGLSFPQLYNHLELNWSNQTQRFKTHTDAFSPSVRQLTYVGNRLLHFWLLSQIHVLTCFSLCCSFRDLSQLILILWKASSLHLPAVLPPFGISGTQVSHPLCSAHPELRLLPSDLLLLHLQCKSLLQLKHTWENPLELPNSSLSSLLSATSGTTHSFLLTPPGPIPLAQLSCMLYIFKFSRLLAKYLY